MFRLAAIFCFLAVAIGAFGAHGLKDVLQKNGMIEVWNKAVFYHFAHGLALLALAMNFAPSRAVPWLFSAGILLFSGSLYAMAVTNLRWLGAITPIGGVCFLAGWLCLIIRPWK